MQSYDRTTVIPMRGRCAEGGISVARSYNRKIVRQKKNQMSLTLIHLSRLKLTQQVSIKKGNSKPRNRSDWNEYFFV